MSSHRVTPPEGKASSNHSSPKKEESTLKLPEMESFHLCYLSIIIAITQVNSYSQLTPQVFHRSKMFKLYQSKKVTANLLKPKGK